MPVTDTTSCCDGPSLSLDAALSAAGVGAFQLRLLALFGLVWAADAMQVLAIGFAAPSIAGEFGLPVAKAAQGGTAFFLGMLIGAWGFGRLADRFGPRTRTGSDGHSRTAVHRSERAGCPIAAC